MPSVRPGLNLEKLQDQIFSLWKQRKDRYSEERSQLGPKHSAKVEMYQIGG